ncbi:Holliday junction branch migration protein RuvA [Candidatus Parcubacteria bacterium]|nr:MAG: Holliday junction branch migration protein RuvA [Candidatus Parcubacteria bacterium]
MISCLEGKTKLRSGKFLIIDVNGVGYKVFVLPDLLRKSEGTIKIWTHLQVREDAMELYGFENYAELEFFEKLIQVSGVGPKSALGIMSIAPVDMIKKAIAGGETAYLTKVSGIGKKTAEKVIIELRDKMGEMTEGGAAIFKDEQDILGALQSLGYSANEAREALKNLPGDVEGVNNKIKAALKLLGK